MLSLESFANFTQAHIINCASFDDLFSIERYVLFTSPHFPQ